MPDCEKLKHIAVFPQGLHSMPGLKKVEKEGNHSIFYFPFPLLTSELKAYLSLHIGFPSHPDIQLLPQQAGMASILATAVVNSE